MSGAEILVFIILFILFIALIVVFMKLIKKRNGFTNRKESYKQMSY
jgi:flagellar biogenesis protein FliO